MVPGMIVGAIILAVGVLIGTRLDRISRVVSSKPEPLEGKNGFLSYRNMKLRNTEDDDS
jgi:hypothetical protein